MKATDVTRGTRVAAISLWEPWATLMAVGAKKNETLSWPTDYRGALLICAAVRKNRCELQHLLKIKPFAEVLRGEPLSHGCAVALVDLDQCTRDHVPSDPYEDAFGDYSAGRFAWITTGLRRLKPFPVKGKRGIFYVTMPPELEEW